MRVSVTLSRLMLRQRFRIRARSVTGSSKINMAIQAVQSELKGILGTGGTINNSINTDIIVSNGESAALGGFISERTLANYGRPEGGGVISEGNGEGIQSSFSVFDFDSAPPGLQMKKRNLLFL